MISEKELKVENRIVAFLDILGFDDLLKSSDDEELKNSFLAFAFLSTKVFEQSLISLRKIQWDETKTNSSIKIDSFQKHTFSDNVAISVAYESHNFGMSLAAILTICASYQKQFLDKGIFIRGGISHGKCLLNNQILFSKALSKAYEIESKQAIYPRICIDPETLNSIDFKNLPNQLQELFDAIILKDWEDIFFINSLEYQIEMEIAYFRYKYSLKIKNLDEKTRISFDQQYQNKMKEHMEALYEKYISVAHEKSIKYQMHQHIKRKYQWFVEYLKYCRIDTDSNIFFTSFKEYLDSIQKNEITPSKNNLKQADSQPFTERTSKH